MKKASVALAVGEDKRPGGRDRTEPGKGQGKRELNEH